ncbi:transketolase family protein [Kitasatospora sp. NPDC056138]|uniref:transketolase family protein n=1 Tax=Kitasatospora sp. NPDC056138 TaxID=3345724 RepID=UPI0035D6E3C0
MSAFSEAHGFADGLPNLDVLDRTLRRLAESDPTVRVLTADSRISGRLEPFARQFPEYVVEIGIAEQNLVGVAAGMAACGRKPFVISPACFLTARSLEQVKVDVGYCANPVRLIGISGGISYGPLGATHHSISDYASLRAIPGITVIAPADNCETQLALEYAAAADEPVYIRLGKRPLECVHGDLPAVPSITEPAQLRTGEDVVLFSTGETVGVCLQAADLLQAQGVGASVVSIPTIRPLDEAGLVRLSAAHRAVVVAEEHSVHGGLGEAIGRVLLTAGTSCRFAALGIPDEPIVNGSQLDVLAHYGISAHGLAQRSRSLLGLGSLDDATALAHV